MTYPFSHPDTGARISATVKWFNPAKAYGFLVPEDGSPDIYCRGIVEIDPPPTGHGPADRSQSFDAHYPDPQAAAPA